METLTTLFGNNIANKIFNMLPTEKDRFYETYYKYTDSYGKNNVRLVSLYKCGCFTLDVHSVYIYSGGDTFYFKCEIHESEIKKCESEIEQLKKECEISCRKRKANLDNILNSREEVATESFYEIP
jgi:hypothetical protein